MSKQAPLLCALVIGHKARSPGAVNRDSGTTEFEFNEALAQEIEALQSEVVIQRVYRRTYNLLPSDINNLNPDFVVSLHCNAYNRRTSGCEVLYYHRSEIGKSVAELLISELVSALGLRNRGVKAVSAEDKGGYLLKYVHSPCMIAEPFFIDNNNDFDIASSNVRELANAYVRAISKIADWLREFSRAASIPEFQNPPGSEKRLPSGSSNTTLVALENDIDYKNEEKAVNRFHIFFGVPNGSLMKLTFSDENGRVICYANLNNPERTIASWQSADIKNPAVAVDDLADSDHFGLMLDLIYLDADKATVKIWIEDTAGNQLDSWSFQLESEAQKAHSVLVTFLMS